MSGTLPGCFISNHILCQRSTFKLGEELYGRAGESELIGRPFQIRARMEISENLLRH